MPIIETETLLVGAARTLRVTVKREDGVQQAASVFRVRTMKPDGSTTSTILGVEPSTVSTYRADFNFIEVGEWTVRMESDSPDGTWEKVYRVLASRFTSPN